LPALEARPTAAPCLDEGFACTPRVAGTAPHPAGLQVLNFAARLSLGKPAWQRLRAFDVPELPGDEWP
jgi:hypothetical protein